MKKKMIRLGACVITFAIFLLGLKELAELTERKASDDKYRPFYEQKEDFDVLFMGSSHVLNGVLPMELWDDYGIVSYNFGGHGCFLTSSYYLLNNALTYTDPKLVVIDCFFLSREEKMVDINYQHLSFDSMPLGGNKIAAVYDIIEAGKRMDFIWDFSIYHNRWNELAQEDFDHQPTVEKGAESKYLVTAAQTEPVPTDEKYTGQTVNVEYLCKMIEECQSRGIEVLLTYIPFPAAEECYMEANRVSDIAQAYGVGYINFLEEGIIDIRTDCADVSPTNGHLNPSGARKVTDYLGRYITEHYGNYDRRTDPAYASWQTDYQDYVRYKETRLKEQNDIAVYLMALADREYDITMEVTDQRILEDEKYRALFENLERVLGGQMRMIFAENSENGVYLDDMTGNIRGEVYAVIMEHGTENVVDEVRIIYDPDDGSEKLIRMEENQ